MFDTTIHRTESKVCPVTKEIEKTISPDKVTEMYDKVEKEVISSIISKHIVKSNYLDAVVIECLLLPTCYKKRIYISFKLNGVEYDSHFDIDRKQILSTHSILKSVRAEYINVLSQLLTEKNLKILTLLQ